MNTLKLKPYAFGAVRVWNIHITASHSSHIGLEGIEGHSGCTFRILHLWININASIANWAELTLQHERQFTCLCWTWNTTNENLQTIKSITRFLLEFKKGAYSTTRVKKTRRTWHRIHVSETPWTNLYWFLTDSLAGDEHVVAVTLAITL